MAARYATEAVYRQVVLRDRAHCQYCGQDCRNTGFVVDHIVPHARGGLSDIYNLVVACRSCNTRKSQSVWLPIDFYSVTAPDPAWRQVIINRLLADLLFRGSIQNAAPHQRAYAGLICELIETELHKIEHQLNQYGEPIPAGPAAEVGR